MPGSWAEAEFSLSWMLRNSLTFLWMSLLCSHSRPRSAEAVLPSAAPSLCLSLLSCLCLLLQVEVIKKAYLQGEVEFEDGENGEDVAASPRNVGHNIYILAHQVEFHHSHKLGKARVCFSLELFSWLISETDSLHILLLSEQILILIRNKKSIIQENFGSFLSLWEAGRLWTEFLRTRGSILGSTDQQCIIFQLYKRLLYTPKEILLRDQLKYNQKSRSLPHSLSAAAKQSHCTDAMSV